MKITSLLTTEWVAMLVWLSVITPVRKEALGGRRPVGESGLHGCSELLSFPGVTARQAGLHGGEDNVTSGCCVMLYYASCHVLCHGGGF